MNNKNIKDTFESFSPSEKSKEEIYRSIINGQTVKSKKGRERFKVKLAYSLAACLVMAAAGIMLLSGPANNGNASSSYPNNKQYAQVSQPPENSSSATVASEKAKFKGFVLTAYTANGGNTYLGAGYTEEAGKQVLVPDVKVLLAKYSPAMSSVPGFPFIVDVIGDEKDDHTLAINVSVNSGGLNEWNRDTGVVTSNGQSATVDLGETIYWSPVFNGNAADKIVINIEAVKDGIVLGRQKICITQDESGYYYATVGELELL